MNSNFCATRVFCYSLSFLADTGGNSKCSCLVAIKIYNLAILKATGKKCVLCMQWISFKFCLLVALPFQTFLENRPLQWLALENKSLSSLISDHAHDIWNCRRGCWSKWDSQSSTSMIWTENAPDIARFVVSISDTIKSNQIKLAKLSCLTSVKEYVTAREQFFSYLKEISNTCCCLQQWNFTRCWNVKINAKSYNAKIPSTVKNHFLYQLYSCMLTVLCALELC